jgi:hypothetical protein
MPGAQPRGTDGRPEDLRDQPRARYIVSGEHLRPVAFLEYFVDIETQVGTKETKHLILPFASEWWKTPAYS